MLRRDYYKDRRRAPRSETRIPAVIELDGGSQVTCVVRNVSSTGMLIEFLSEQNLPDRFQLHYCATGAVFNCVVRRNSGRQCGVCLDGAGRLSA